jgi:enoyl-CoA hydratase
MVGTKAWFRVEPIVTRRAMTSAGDEHDERQYCVTTAGWYPLHMSPSVVEREQHGTVAVLRLHHPPVNAFDLDVGRDLEAALEAILRSDSAALVLTGTGRCFSAGLNLKVVPSYGPAEQRAMVETANRMLGRLYACPLPTVAAVNGHAIAAGLVLALTCDYRVGPADTGLFGLTEARAGIPFPGAAMAIVRAELAPAVARTLTLVARNVESERAAALGILDELVPLEEVLPRAIATAADLATMPRAGYVRIKHQLRAPTIAALEAIAGGADPMLASWLDPNAREASGVVLRGTRTR